MEYCSLSLRTDPKRRGQGEPETCSRAGTRRNGSFYEAARRPSVIGQRKPHAAEGDGLQGKSERLGPPSPSAVGDPTPRKHRTWPKVGSHLSAKPLESPSAQVRWLLSPLPHQWDPPTRRGNALLAFCSPVFQKWDPSGFSAFRHRVHVSGPQSSCQLARELPGRPFGLRRGDAIRALRLCSRIAPLCSLQRSARD